MSRPSPTTRLTTRPIRLRRIAALGFGLVVAWAAWPTAAGATLPKQFEAVDIKNKLGEKVNLAVPLVDHTGRSVRLGDYLDGKRPLILTLNYYRCDSMCTVQLNELLDSVKKMGWIPGGDEYDILTVSFDPRDDTEVASGKRMTYLRDLAQTIAARDNVVLAPDEPAEIDARADALGWTFATATPAAIRVLTEELGYMYTYDAPSGQYAHAPVIYILSPEGVIARYLYGITYPPRDLKFALMEASGGRIGSFGEKVLLSCFSFDPDGGGYHAFAWGFMRLGGALIVLLLGGWLLVHFHRERRARRLSPGLTGSSLRGSTPLV